MKYRQFEDLPVWKDSANLAIQVYEFTVADEFRRHYGLRDQLERAVQSISNNIAEGFERRSLREFHQFLTIAKASCAELRSQLYVALDCGYLSQATFDELRKQSDEVARIISGLRTAVEKKRQEQAIKR